MASDQAAPGAGSQLLEKTLAAMRDAKLLPVRLESLPGQWLRDSLHLAGDLDTYLDAVQAVGAPVVFWHARQLYGEDFVSKDASGQVVDLTVLEPSLERFRERIGTVGAITLGVLHEGGVLRYTLTDPWFEQFMQHSLNAEATIASSEDPSETQEERRARLLS